MPRDLILGTAGHIDHGKTSLVKALTGIDTDRLPEEKARGITIDIGFAHLELGDFRLGIVDVPGHERFVKNMLAGATGIDLVVLIVAADDSVMPQTREHLDILKLLGLRQGVIALTKADLVDDITREVAELEIRELVQGSFLENAPIIPTSTVTGQGIAELKAAIEGLCRALAPQSPGGEGSETPFRLPIDRSFTVQGHGTVVTGSIVSGSVKVGDELEWHKGDGTKETVRVRSLNNHGKPTDELHRGQRGAINLAGVPHEAVRRGQELATPHYLSPSKVLTVRLHALAANRKPIKHRLPCRLHIGTAEVMVTISVLDADGVEAGQWAIAQLFLEEPVTAVWGQPFVLRDSSAEHTLGGGQVLQPCGTKIRRRQLDALERAEQLGIDDPIRRATAVAWFAGFAGFAATDLVREAGVMPGQVEAVSAALVQNDTVVELVLPPHRKLLVHTDRVNELGERLLATLGALHEQNPLMTNHDRQKVLARLDYIGDEPLLQAIADRLIKQKKLVGDTKRIARADFKPKLSVNQRKLKDKIVDEHKKAGFQPPEPGTFANQAGGNAAALKDIFEVACAEGFLVRVTDDIYLHADADAEMRKKVTEKLATVPGLTVAEIRDLLGTTRKFAVPICEFLDRTGLTKRNGDLRVRAGS
jgi:selenocysteine-specific elongation factor